MAQADLLQEGRSIKTHLHGKRFVGYSVCNLSDFHVF